VFAFDGWFAFGAFVFPSFEEWQATEKATARDRNTPALKTLIRQFLLSVMVFDFFRAGSIENANLLFAWILTDLQRGDPKSNEAS
jgi:hypothetical protein